MPQVSAAVFRSLPSRTSARASIRRAALASRLLLAARLISAEVRFRLVIANAADIPRLLLPHRQRQSPGD